MSRNVRLYLDDLIKSCERILKYNQGMTFDEFVADDRTYDAVVQNLDLGEAVKQIPQNLRNRSLETEWRNITGLRDIGILCKTKCNL